MLRGLLEEKYFKKELPPRFSIKGLEQIISFSDKEMVPRYKEEVVNSYFNNEESCLPLHTCIFNNKMFQYHFKDLLQEFKLIDKDAKNIYLNEEYNGKPFNYGIFIFNFNFNLKLTI
jgi:hypothetical protein